MDPGFNLKYENPVRKANFFSKSFFIWMIRLFRKGSSRGLKVQDLYKTLPTDQSDHLGDVLEGNWNEEIAKAKAKNKKPSLIKALAKTYLGKYMCWGVVMFIQYAIIRPVQPMILAQLLMLFTSYAPKDGGVIRDMYLYGSGVVGFSVILIFMVHHSNYGQTRIGMRIRVGVSSLVYRKLMKLNKSALKNTAAGQVVNLLSNDVNRFDLVVLQMHFLWIMPFQIGLVTFFIWQKVGISTLAGVVSMVLFTIPGQGYLGKVTSNLRRKIASKTDRRVVLMNEVISGIQVIKMYVWEKPFEKLIHWARNTEINSLTKSAYLQGIYLSSMVFIERATLFLTCVCFVLTGNVLTADIVFPMAQFFNILQMAMAMLYPSAITYSAESLVAIRRLEKFLFLDEKQEADLKHTNDGSLVVSNVDAEWVKGNTTLENISFTVPKGSLCAIIGPVGSGKTTLLQLFLGELIPKTGKISIGGEISYSSQEAWLFSSSVRNNILFGLEYNYLRYKQVIKVCALEKDFKQFPQGDKTVVGEKGVSLSGGQRARINLARAIYRQADIYLLDDPLSAVDTHVGRHLFDKCISRHLKGKTRVLITHQLQYLKSADHIIVLDEGRIAAQGTFEELSDSNLDFTKLLIASDEQQDKPEEPVVEKSLSKRRSSKSSAISSLITDSMEMEVQGSIDNEIQIFRDSSCKDEKSYISDSFEMELKESNVVEEEEVMGDLSPFKEYFKAAGSKCALILLVITLILGQIASSGADYWVTYWTQQEAIRHANGSILKVDEPSMVLYDTFLNGNLTESTSMKTNVAIYIYTIFIIGSIVFTLMRAFLFFSLCMRASRNLHKKMFNCLLKAPMRFFDTNPTGRILNRFSKDIGAIDELLPRVMIVALQITLVMIGILVNVSISNPHVIIAVIVLGILFILLMNCYIATTRAIKHIEGITKSPMFSHVNSSLNGLTTIRASKAQQTLINEFDHHQDVHTSSWFLTISCVVSFGLWLDIICVIFVACVTYSFVFLASTTEVNGSLVGLAISQSLILTGMLQNGMRQTAEVINQLTSVERVLHYTKIDQEGPFETDEHTRPSKSWPDKGDVRFIKLYLKYVESDPPVLKNLNIDIHPGEKIGIVGRTGAGKSSLITALFRLSPIEGNLIIDGLNTKEIGLSDLRKKISIIPQEPVLFSATLRYNLDPLQEYKDEQLWRALEEVELKDAASSLDFQVSEGGSNFSLGQRQLICLARAILRMNKVLVLDEATANVDPQTDYLIQKTIRTKFANCTVLTIAHRLNTIMDSDKVLVMESGTMVEFDHPHLLLQNPEGYFHKMVLETGPSMTSQLKDVAQEAYESRNCAYSNLLVIL
ncbi:unnamed protein product [Brassicogethes aeneus]|uniref:Uncharacterized protein n=1 Tax=Brassicogethes aeneus TaxID=1431903 RepID=A0A9P0B9B2_BRAAE|nr:unnamed protein product [Brassicogethes aeneus]